MKTTRRDALKAFGAAGVSAGSSALGFPAIAQNLPLRVGILAPKAGVVGYIGENGLRATQWATGRINASGGIAGRQVELVIEEETSPKDTIERFRKLVLRERVDCVQGVVSSGVGLAMGPQVEESRALTIFWDGTTQDGVRETIKSPRYLFRSTDNECETVMACVLVNKHWKGRFETVAGINPDYSYGRINWEAFLAFLKRFGIPARVVSELWTKVGNLDFNSHVATLKAAKPDLIFSSLVFADLPVFMRTAHAAGLFEGTKLVLPGAGHQHALLKKSFTPEGAIFAHNTLYFALEGASPTQTRFVQDYREKYQDFPHWECDRAYFAMELYRAGVEKAAKARGGWPTTDDAINAMEGIQIQSLGGPGGMRKDHIAEQTFYQGLTTHKNDFDITTLGTAHALFSDKLQKPTGGDFWQWIQTTEFPTL